MAPETKTKVLRIGVVQGEKLSDERIFRPGETVTVGHGPKNTLVLPGLGLPKRFPMFTATGTGYTLSFTEAMTGAVALETGALMKLEDLRARSTRKGDVWTFPLNDRLRGKVSFGGTTLLFQFVPPPQRTRADRRSFAWFKQIDSIYLRFLILSAVVHPAIMTHALSLPRPPEPTIDEVLESRTIFIPRPIAKPKEKDLETAKTDPDRPKPAPKPVKIAMRPPMRDPKPPPVTEPTREERVDRVKGIGLLGGLDRFRTSDLGRQILDGTASIDDGTLEDTFRSKRAIVVASAGPALKGSSGGPDVGDVKVGPIGRPTEPIAVPVAMKKKTPIPDVKPITLTGDDRDRATTDAYIKGHMAAVTACYERALNQNPTLQGKFYIDFTIEPTGRVSNLSLRAGFGAVDDVLQSCLEVAIGSRWRFPAADGAVDISMPLVFTAQQ